MSSNRGNNRRRGRGSNRPQGGQPVNRIDSRARGNAPQMLEKYRKLALDSHLNGDRVTEEYYLQFADHYFRVMADMKQRQEEGRPPRSDRWQDGNDANRDDGDDAGEYGAYPAEREDRGGRGEREERGEQEGNHADEARGSGDSRGYAYEPAENPFVRGEGRPARNPKPRRPRGDSRDGGDEQDRQSAQASGLDPAMLPPSISASADTSADEGEAESVKKPAARTRKRSTRSANPTADDAGESLQAVN